VLKGGILTTGNAKSPIRPYGGDIDGDGSVTDHDFPGKVPVAIGGEVSLSTKSNSPSEGVSFTKGNRGDRI
jgi:hypothetical protein